MRKLLLITYHFPPDAEVGGIRPYQLARHLPDLGFDAHVVTVEPAFAESLDPHYQPEGVPLDRIIRTGVETTLRDRALRPWQRGTQAGDRPVGTDPSSSGQRMQRPARPRGSLRSWVLRWLAFPDLRFGWYGPALQAAERLLAAERYDVILSTSPPRVAHMVACRLSKRHRVPWVMDLRDPWYDTGTTPLKGSGMLTHFHRVLFKRHAAHAALLVTNTEPLRRHLERTLGPTARRTACIPNGLDPASATPGAAAATAFSIGHFGQITGRRSAGPFLEGLRRWMDLHPSAADRAHVRFVGSGFSQARPLAESLRLGNVSFEPRVPRADVPRLMSEQYALLVLANDQPLQVPGKAYEYLAASRRILACTEKDSASADVLAPAPGCAIAESPEAVARALEQWWNEHAAGGSPHVDRTMLLASMTYRRRAEQFAELLQVVTTGTTRGEATQHQAAAGTRSNSVS